MDSIIESLRSELQINTDPAVTKGHQKFFKEGAKFYGVKTSVVHKISKKYFKEIKGLDKADIFVFCEELFKSGYTEDFIVACDWLPGIAGTFVRGDIKVFEGWIDSYVDNWAKCDTFCNHTVGDFLVLFPDEVSHLKEWAKSENHWMRRAAAVSLIIPAKKGKFMNDIFEIADILLEDEDDMVRKGYGWLLKDLAITKQKDVFDYVMENKRRMPRVSLRYAIERMPKEMRAEAMKKDW